MVKQTRSKQERVVEAVRRGLEGEDSVAFVCQSGYAMSIAGIARHLRALGGRGRVQELINAGKSNIEILELCFPGDDLEGLEAEPPSQGDFFHEEDALPEPPSSLLEMDMFGSRRISLKVPEDVYEALRLAARAERKSQNDLVVEILTRALSQMPHGMDEDAAR
jgi:predicted HicB family RNase H-like nuclease